jgi:hypothetical protein
MGENFRASGYFVSTIELKEEIVRACIRNQVTEEVRYGQLEFGNKIAALGDSWFSTCP